MSLRSNGSVIGPRLAPTTSAASGVWSLRAAQLAKSVSIWPLRYGEDAYWSSVSLLLLGNSLSDSSANNLTVTKYGDAQVSTSVKKYGSGSIALDGTGDYLTVPGSSLFNLSSGDSTIEYWVYKLSDKLCTHVSQGGSNWRVQGNPNGTITLNLSSSDRITSSSISTANWHHVAVVRSGSTTTLYINGTSAGTTTSTATNSNADTVYVGNNPDALGTWAFNGYIDDLRVTKGVARYTANFTAPIAELPASGQ